MSRGYFRVGGTYGKLGNRSTGLVTDGEAVMPLEACRIVGGQLVVGLMLALGCVGLVGCSSSGSGSPPGPITDRPGSGGAGGSTSTGDDHGGSRSTATRVGVPSDTSGNIGSSNDVDYFRITVSESGTIEVYSSGSVDVVGELQDSSGRRVARNDDGGAGWNFRIQERVSRRVRTTFEWRGSVPRQAITDSMCGCLHRGRRTRLVARTSSGGIVRT